MAKVQVQVAGGSIVQKEVETLGELKELMNASNYTATINGEPESDDNYSLSDFEFITLAPAVKGA